MYTQNSALIILIRFNIRDGLYKIKLVWSSCIAIKIFILAHTTDLSKLWAKSHTEMDSTLRFWEITHNKKSEESFRNTNSEPI